MRLFKRWYLLTPAERLLLIEAWALLWGIKAALTLVPFRIVHHWVTAGAGRLRRLQIDPHETERQLRWAVLVIARYTPWRLTCLERAMAGLVLANRLGCSAELRIGVGRRDNNEFQAHAWLEGVSGVILGELDDLSSYVLLPTIKPH
jgi:hypothetical protein